MNCFGILLEPSWETSKSITITTTPAMVFSVLKDVEAWPEWDDGLNEAYLDEPDNVVEGAEGTLVMKERGEFRFTLTDLDETGYFAYETVLKGATAKW
jgi:hypothetical protein